MNRFILIREYLSYYLSAKTKHGIHSPFVFEFVTKVLNKRFKDGQTKKIEKLRKELSASSRMIKKCDFGVGSESGSSGSQSVKDIIKNSAKSKKYAGLLCRIIRHFNFKKALELGTSAGISSMYMATAMPMGKVITIEGNPEIAKLSVENFDKVGITNITQVTSNFDEVLDGILAKEKLFDIIFFDGNHREEATIRYFNQCLSCIHNETVFVFDDINWSDGMKQAWLKIKQHPSVKVSIDLFFLGIVFFRRELSKEDFVVRF